MKASAHDIGVIATVGMAAGVLIMIQPWFPGMRAGFALTALFTIIHNIVSHIPERRR